MTSFVTDLGELWDKLWKIKWFARMVKPESVDKVSHFYERFGIFTLIVGRFAVWCEERTFPLDWGEWAL